MSTVTSTIDIGSRPIHVIGCGGAGMAPITAVLAHLGVPVSGSDQRPSETLQRLAELGVAVTVGADYGAVPADAALVRSTAIPDSHPEVSAALGAGRPVHRRAEVLAAITSAFRTVSVAGTHGKTTTASMTAAVLMAAGVPVTTIIGGRILGVDHIVPGALLGDPGGVLVVEADESDGTFVELDTDIAVVTNLEPDHLEFYGGEDGLREAFAAFVSAPELLAVVACTDDRGVRDLLGGRAERSCDVVTYGETESADLRLVYAPARSQVHHRGTLHDLRVGPPGRHNALNMTAALGVLVALGHPVGEGLDGAAAFAGVGRRFEVRGSAAGVTVIDDYAHLAGEIRAAISAARDRGDGRVVAVFQPHRYSRTAALWPTFAGALQLADAVVVTDIYASGEQPRTGVSSGAIVDDLRRIAPKIPVRRVGEPAEVAAAVAPLLTPGDTCLLLSAGDLPGIAEAVLAEIARVLDREAIDAR